MWVTTRGVVGSVSAVFLASNLLCGCYTTRYYSENAGDLDNVYFGHVDDGPNQKISKKATWRNYFVFGLIPSEGADKWPPERLKVATRNGAIVHDLEIKTQKSFLNGLAEVGVALIPLAGILRPLFMNLRQIELSGRQGR